MSVTDAAQCVEYLINSVNDLDNTLQATIRLILVNTDSVRKDFKKAVDVLINMDPYRKSQYNSPSVNKIATLSSVNFGAGGRNLGVDLCSPHPKQCKDLSDE